MHVDSLRLFHFRNYESLEVSFHPHLNLLLGANAQGKTNILEALYFLSTARSFRVADDEQVVQLNQEEGSVEGTLYREEGQEQIRLEIRKGKNKTLFLNGKKQQRLSSLLGRLPSVVFSPDDLLLVKGGSASRRRYLDMAILQLDQAYRVHLQKYERALKQRNSLLRQRVPRLENQLTAWDEPLAEHGAVLMEKRAEVASRLSFFAQQALKDLTGGSEHFEICYEPCLEMEGSRELLNEKIAKALLEARREDIARGLTIAGPHRDDLGFWLNGHSLARYGSQGQQRTGALALKLSQLSVLAEGCHTAPLILFDDVMAELDQKRQEFFLNRLLQEGQAILTGTSPNDFRMAINIARIFSVEGGKVDLKKVGS